MLRRKPRLILGAVVMLMLAACGQMSEPASNEEQPSASAPSDEPSASSAATPTEFCAEVGRRVSPQDCADFAALAENAAAGSAAFNAPDPMQRGEAHTLQLAISFALTPEQVAAREQAERERAEAEAVTTETPSTEQTDQVAPSTPSAPAQPSPPTPSDVVDPLAGETVEFTPLVGRFMRAELVGNGFEITPLTPASQEVLQDSVTTWNWRVVATEGGRRSLTLRTVVEGCTAEGQCYPLRSTSQNYDVTVTVGLVGQAQDVLTAAPTWLRLLAGVLTALAVLIGAWFGLRNAFRKGRA